MKNSSIEGLLIRGSVTGRTRRNVGAKNIELVTYRISAGENIYFVKDWAPKEYLTVGKTVELPICAKTHQNNGHALIDYTISNSSTFGEEF